MVNTNNLNKAPAAYHPVTRWLHAGLVLGVIFQLTCAAFMAHPEHADGGHAGAVAHAEGSPAHHSGHVDMASIAAEAQAEPFVMAETPAMDMKKGGLSEWLMDAHRTGGILVALILLANLIWAIIPRGTPRKRQIAVLFSALHWREAWLILKRLGLMLVGKGGLPEPGNPLSLIVEMLGMLTMAAMAVSGAVIWSVWAGPSSSVTEYAEVWLGVHETIAVLLLLYLAGHVSMALLHMRSGDLVFSRISPIPLKK